MLRILVISLFVANLLLFGFQRNNPAVEEETTVASTAKKHSDVPTIHLFSEMIQDEGLLTGNRQCFSLGPFHSSEDKDETRLLLQEISTRISERQTEALVEKGYWVFMPPYDSLLEANEALISLQALGLEDIGIIFDGEWKNAISLGYFMRQENALRRKKSVESRNYAPMIRVQRQGEPRYWLDYEQPPGSSLLALDMQDRPNDFMQRALPCPEEDIIEFTEAQPEEPAQVMAQLQVPEGDEQSLAAENEDPDTGERIENLLQEADEPLVVQPIETGAEDGIEAGSDDVIETEPEVVIDTGPENIVVTEPVNATDTESEGVIETEPGNTDATDSENTPESGQENGIEPRPVNTVGTGRQDDIESEAEDADGTGPESSIETTPEEPDETASGEG